jgi:hypothetical protein
MGARLRPECAGGQPTPPLATMMRRYEHALDLQISDACGWWGRTPHSGIAAPRLARNQFFTAVRLLGAGLA